MKIFIQHVASKRFVGRNAAWVSSIALAQNFHTSLLALNFCFARHLSPVQIRACFENSACDVVWPVIDTPRS